MKESHKSPKFVDFVESAPFPEAISKAPADFLDFRLLGPPKWREPHKSRHFHGPVDFLDFRPPRGRNEGTPQKQQNRPFRNVRSFSGSHSKASVDFVDFRPPGPPKAGLPRFRPGHSSTNPELVREEPPKARNLVTVSRIVAGVPRFRPGDSSMNPELVREEPPKARNLVTVSRIVPIQKDK